MFFKPIRGASLLEYSILLAVVMSSLLIMQFYVKRGYQGRLKQEADSVGQQYSPGHTNSLIVTTSNSTTTTRTADGITTVTVSPATSTLTKQEAIDSFATEE